MILPEISGPSMVTIRRGGTLGDENENHQQLALWAADCTEHVLHFFDYEQQVRQLVIEDQDRRNSICWSAFSD